MRPSTRNALARRILLIVVPTALCCCRSTQPPSDLRRIYEAAAVHRDAARTPVVVIPGILGSRLVDGESGQVVWGAFTPGSPDPRSGAGARLIALPMREGATLAELADGVRPDGALDRVRFSIFGVPVDLLAYAQILSSLGVGGYRDSSLAEAIDYGSDHYTCFQFAYDWRRDLVESARALDGFLREKEAYVRGENARRFGTAPDAPIRFDVVAHSMGGLVLRWYLRYGTAEPGPDGSPPPLTWAGAERIERAILVGTPSFGSLDALSRLVQGFDPGLFLPTYPAAVIGTFPSLYELLPRGRHGALLDEHGDPIEDLFDPDLWERRGWGLADPRQDQVLRDLLRDTTPAERRLLALDHQRKCLARARAVTAALDRPAAPPEGTSLYLFAGDAEPTPRTLAIDTRGLPAVRARAPGDGVVLRSSALADERLDTRPGRPAWEPRLRSPIAWHQVFFLFTDHLGVTRDPAFTDNALYLLLEEPRGGRAPAAHPVEHPSE